jgi:hypothetical protein
MVNMVTRGAPPLLELILVFIRKFRILRAGAIAATATGSRINNVG